MVASFGIYSCMPSQLYVYERTCVILIAQWLLLYRSALSYVRMCIGVTLPLTKFLKQFNNSNYTH